MTHNVREAEGHVSQHCEISAQATRRRQQDGGMTTTSSPALPDPQQPSETTEVHA